MLLKLYELFNGTLRNWDAESINFHSKPEVSPYDRDAFPVPQVHEATLYNVLELQFDSKWDTPMFIIPKKNHTVGLISNF